MMRTINGSMYGAMSQLYFKILCQMKSPFLTFNTAINTYFEFRIIKNIPIITCAHVVGTCS